jgi:hypothetical protein
MNKILSLLATAALATGTVLADNYTPWGYYMGNMEENLGLIGAGTATLRIAIFVPGDGILRDGTIAGVNVPVADASAVTALSAWVTPTLSSSETYTQQVDLTGYANGFNQAVFAEPYTVTESGCYVGYTITVNTALKTQGSQYPAVYDPSIQAANSFWIWYSAQYGWQDIGTQYGASCVQALFSDLKLPETGARFGQVQNAVTEMNAESEFPVTVYSDASEAVNNIEYTIDVAGVSETRTADVAIPAGFNQSGEVKVKVNSPAEAGSYDVALTITKVNGKDNTMAGQTSVTTFNNLLRIVERNTLVEEFTGTGCGWCPRGMQGMANLRAEFGERFIGLAFHAYNTSDPMYPNYYISASKLGISGAPSCVMDRKEVMDPYYGTQKNERYVLQDFEDYSSIPAEVDIDLKAEWADNDKVQLDAKIEPLVDDKYEVVYVLTADSLTGTSTAWRQSNYYNQYSAAEVGDADLAKFCKGGEYGTSRFAWNFDDVVIASSYNSLGNNQAASLGSLAAGQSVEDSYTLSLPAKATLRTAVDASIDKVYAVAFVLNSEGAIAQAVKVAIAKSSGEGIESVREDVNVSETPTYDLQGRQISTPRRGQLFIRDGKKMIVE